MAFVENHDAEDKLDRAINSIISQIEYLTNDFPVNGNNKVVGLSGSNSNKSAYDPNKDKIRASSDLVWQLSTALTQLMAAKNSIMLTNKLAQESDSLYDLLNPSGSYRE